MQIVLGLEFSETFIASNSLFPFSIKLHELVE